MIAPDMIVAAPAALAIPAAPAAGRPGPGHPHIFVPAIIAGGPGQTLPAQAAAQQPDQHDDNETHEHPSLVEAFAETRKFDSESPPAKPVAYWERLKGADKTVSRPKR
jgi:hypothetical protein